MIKTSVKNNIKSIIRDPTVILAFLAAIILRFIRGIHSYVGPNGNFIDKTFSVVANILLQIIPTTSGEKEAFTYYRDGAI